MDRAKTADAIARLESSAIKLRDAKLRREAAQATLLAAEDAVEIAGQDLRAARDTIYRMARDGDGVFAKTFTMDDCAEPFTMDDGPMYAGIFGW